MKGKNTAGHFSALLTIIVWGTTFISTKILLVDFQALEIHFTPLQATKTPVFSIGSQHNEAIEIL